MEKLPRSKDPNYLLEVFEVLDETFQDKDTIVQQYASLSTEYQQELTLESNDTKKSPEEIALEQQGINASQLALDQMRQDDLSDIDSRLLYIVRHLGGVVGSHAISAAKEAYVQQAGPDDIQAYSERADRYERLLVLGTMIDKYQPHELERMIRGLGIASLLQAGGLSSKSPSLSIDGNAEVRIVEYDTDENGKAWTSLTSPRAVEYIGKSEIPERIVTTYPIIDITVSEETLEITALVKMGPEKEGLVTFSPDSDIYRLSKDKNSLELYIPAGRRALLDMVSLPRLIAKAQKTGDDALSTALNATGARRPDIFTTFTRDFYDSEGRPIANPHPVSVAKRS